eukprot:27952_1
MSGPAFRYADKKEIEQKIQQRLTERTRRPSNQFQSLVYSPQAGTSPGAGTGIAEDPNASASPNAASNLVAPSPNAPFLPTAHSEATRAVSLRGSQHSKPSIQDKPSNTRVIKNKIKTRLVSARLFQLRPHSSRCSPCASYRLPNCTRFFIITVIIVIAFAAGNNRQTRLLIGIPHSHPGSNAATIAHAGSFAASSAVFGSAQSACFRGIRRTAKHPARLYKHRNCRPYITTSDESAALGKHTNTRKCTHHSKASNKPTSAHPVSAKHSPRASTT